MVRYFLAFLIAFFVPILSYFYYPSLLKELLKDIRLMRILHYVGLTGLGFILFFEKIQMQVLLEKVIFLKFIVFVFALIYAAVFAIISNNFEDLETDKISNPNRPLVQNTVDKKLYWNAGIVCQVVAFLLAGLAQIEIFIGLFCISFGYYIYSCRPFRLKKIPFLAKLLIGFNSLAVTLTGFVLAGGQIQNFPLIWVFYILVPLSLAANFVDLKDIEGDKAMKVNTLPVIWGEKKAKFFIACMTAIAYFVPALLLNMYWIYPLVLLLLALHIRFLYAKPYNEKPIFFLYVSSIFSLNFLLLFAKYF
jgi:4-hydroxybenzoate polyprenyltransferase